MCPAWLAHAGQPAVKRPGEDAHEGEGWLVGQCVDAGGLHRLHTVDVVRVNAVQAVVARDDELIYGVGALALDLRQVLGAHLLQREPQDGLLRACLPHAQEAHPLPIDDGVHGLPLPERSARAISGDGSGVQVVLPPAILGYLVGVEPHGYHAYERAVDNEAVVGALGAGKRPVRLPGVCHRQGLLGPIVFSHEYLPPRLCHARGGEEHPK